jgi:Nif11 domain
LWLIFSRQSLWRLFFTREIFNLFAEEARMSKHAQNFIKKAAQDKELRKQLMDCYQKKQAHAIEKLAEQCGCPCTYQEIVSCFKQEGFHHEKLTDQE